MLKGTRVLATARISNGAPRRLGAKMDATANVHSACRQYICCWLQDSEFHDSLITSMEARMGRRLR